MSQNKLSFKVVASKAYIAGGSLVLASMVFTTVFMLITEDLNGTAYFAAPLMSFYVAIPLFVVLYPIIFLVVLALDWRKLKKNKINTQE